ncbi:calcium-binding protein P-like isoform X2 [Orbicella faveolata]|uniref:calcium-binding protein P-like isoform X2 n=1 Tax=Orbicella faveolata TaxID=48498 RepID=UPI0009E500C3|nr:calcium-binding protein P-like isoform X2 [Orbicella faveolata]
MGTVKAGYLHKLSGFFKNSWKRRYFVLYQDGVFSYYQDSKDKECDGKIHMKTECRRINVGHAVGEGVKPPKDSDINAMFCVSSPERTWYLYAETESDAREWISLLEQARVPLTYGGPQNPPVPRPSYPSYGAPNAAAYGAAPNPAPYGAAPSVPGGGAHPPPIGFNPSVVHGGSSSGPPPPYSQGPPQPQGAYGQPPPYPSGPPPPRYAPNPYPQPIAPQQPSYPSQAYPQQPPGGYPQQAHGQYYPTPPPGQYPQQQYYGNPAHHTTYVQGGKPQTVYMQQPPQQHSGRNKMMMGAAAGVVGGAAMGYMLGHTVGGFGHHGFGGWGSDHSWSSGGSFDCDFD